MSKTIKKMSPQHHHCHHHHHESHKSIKIAFFLNLSFTLIELVGGLLTNSIAIIADTLHDLGDTIALGFSWGMEILAKKAPNKTFSYGYRRFSLLSALISGIILLTGSIYLISQAVERAMNPVTPHLEGMAYLSILGIAVNGFAAYRTGKGKTLNERMVSWHMIEDTLGWVAVLISTGLMWKFDWPILDSALAIGFSVFILINVIRNLKKTIWVFLQAVPDTLDMSQIYKEVADLPQILETHDAHIWSLDGEHHVLSLHIVIENGLDQQEHINLKCQVKELLKTKGITHTTIEFETKEEACTENCYSPS